MIPSASSAPSSSAAPVEEEESLERERAEEGRTFADLEPVEDELAERTFEQDENDPYSDAEVEEED